MDATTWFYCEGRPSVSQTRPSSPKPLSHDSIQTATRYIDGYSHSVTDPPLPVVAPSASFSWYLSFPSSFVLAALVCQFVFPPYSAPVPIFPSTQLPPSLPHGLRICCIFCIHLLAFLRFHPFRCAHSSLVWLFLGFGPSATTA
jgi:hypothetical protein